MDYSKILILVLVAVLAGFGLLRITFDTQKEIDGLAKIPEVETQQEQVKLIIDGEDPIEKQVKINSGQTVFDVLERSGVEFDYEEYESGIFIRSIEGVSGPVKHWTYYVNKKLAKKSVDQVQVKDGDIIEFKHQRSPF